MKIGKIVIIFVIVSSLLSISGNVVAVQENEIITDPAEDVYSLDILGTGEEEFTYITEHDDIDVDNIDIREASYERNNNAVTVTIKVEGIIENRGNLDAFNLDDPSFENFLQDGGITNAVSYSFELLTSNDQYTITYVNNSCNLISSSTGEQINLTESDFFVNNNLLTVNFDLLTEDETYEEMSVMTNYMKIDWEFMLNYEPNGDEIDDSDLFTYLTDVAPNPPLVVEADVQTVGEVNVPIDFYGVTLYGQPPVNYHWDFGDGTTSVEKNPTHTYTEAGVYQFTFTATDNSGYSDSASYEIEILGGDTEDTPGFEVLVAFIALGILFWFKKKE